MGMEGLIQIQCRCFYLAKYSWVGLGRCLAFSLLEDSTFHMQVRTDLTFQISCISTYTWMDCTKS